MCAELRRRSLLIINCYSETGLYCKQITAKKTVIPQAWHSYPTLHLEISTFVIVLIKQFYYVTVRFVHKHYPPPHTLTLDLYISVTLTSILNIYKIYIKYVLWKFSNFKDWIDFEVS